MHLKDESIDTPHVHDLSRAVLLPRWQVLNIRYLRGVAGWSRRGIARRYKLTPQCVRTACTGVRRGEHE